MQRERARWPNKANSTIASMQEFVAHVQRNFFPDAGSEGAIGGNDDNTLAVAGHADLAGLLINVSAPSCSARRWTDAEPMVIGRVAAGQQKWQHGLDAREPACLCRVKPRPCADFITEPGRPYGGGLP